MIFFLRMPLAPVPSPLPLAPSLLSLAPSLLSLLSCPLPLIRITSASPPPLLPISSHKVSVQFRLSFGSLPVRNSPSSRFPLCK